MQSRSCPWRKNTSLLVSQAITYSSSYCLIKAVTLLSHLLLGFSYWVPEYPLLCHLISPSPGAEHPLLSVKATDGSKKSYDTLFHPQLTNGKVNREQDPWRAGKNSWGRTAGKTGNLHLAVQIHISPWHLSQLHVSPKETNGHVNSQYIRAMVPRKYKKPDLHTAINNPERCKRQIKQTSQFLKAPERLSALKMLAQWKKYFRWVQKKSIAVQHEKIPKLVT